MCPNRSARSPHLKLSKPDAQLRDGRADIGYLRRPFDDAGLPTVPIGSESKVACVPASHPLARRRALRTADLDGETILDAHARRTSSIEKKFELIAAGHGIAMVPRSVTESYSQPDLVYLQVTDAEPVETYIAVAEGRRERRVRDFVTLAEQTLRGSRATLAAADCPSSACQLPQLTNELTDPRFRGPTTHDVFGTLIRRWRKWPGRLAGRSQRQGLCRWQVL
jgi:hypothetical protein